MSMILPDQKIQVFLSSSCGNETKKQKYNLVREALKVLIESTGFAKVYVFESAGASTITAGQHYTLALEDCDVCIFLIDNKDGVPDGVQKEIDTAKKHGIMSFFYFCDQRAKETPLQKSLKGAQYAKSETVHDFKDFINSGAIGLISDLVAVYKHYCKRRLTWWEKSSFESSVDISNVEMFSYSNIIASKDMLANIDCCINFFDKLLFGQLIDAEDKKTGEIDRLCASFLSVLFEGALFNSNTLDSLLIEISKQQNAQHFNITQERYSAIKEYYAGNQEGCITHLNQALQMAKDNSMPEWLKKDILIDLRNQDLFLQERNNANFRVSQYQHELERGISPTYYPLLDRFNSNYYEGIIEQAIKYEVQSPETISFGHYLRTHIKSLASIYVLAMYNGSLSHLYLLYERTRYLSFHCALYRSSWSIKKLLLKTTIIGGKQKEIDDILRRFSDICSDMSEQDAHEIYSFADNRPIFHQKLVAKLKAFRVINYYLTDDDFDLIWADLYSSINQWIADVRATTVIGGHIFAAIEGSHLRIQQDQIIEIICGFMRKDKRIFYYEAFKVISNCIDLDSASPDKSNNLLDSIIKIIRTPEERSQIRNLETALCMLRKKYRRLTEVLDKTISEEMPDFYNGVYRLETTVNEDKDMPAFLDSYIKEINQDNEIQGKNGVFHGRQYQVHVIVRKILAQSNAEFSELQIDSAFMVSCDTLLIEKQTIQVKMDAIALLIYIIKSQPNIRTRNKNKIAELLSNKSKIEKATSIMTNLNETNLRFSALLLYSALGENVIAELMVIIADMKDDALSNMKASAAIRNYLEADHAPLTDFRLEHIFLQQAIVWSMESNLDIRLCAVQILFLLLHNLDNASIICNHLVKLMDSDNVYVKNYILKDVHKTKSVDVETYKYIIQKGILDINFAIRLVANEVQQKN